MGKKHSLEQDEKSRSRLLFCGIEAIPGVGLGSSAELCAAGGGPVKQNRNYGRSKVH